MEGFCKRILLPEGLSKIERRALTRIARDCKNNCVTAIFFLNLKATYVAPLLVKSTVVS